LTLELGGGVDVVELGSEVDEGRDGSEMEVHCE
jgi:hypothetical protein